MLLKKRRTGRKISEMSVGEKLTFTEKIEDKDLLLYLGLTDDANPLYIQHDYASKTKFKQPIAPSILLNGILFSTISKYLPGPGSHIVGQHLQFPNPVYHYECIHFHLEVKEINKDEGVVIIGVVAKNEKDINVIMGDVTVIPPTYTKSKIEKIIDNF